MVFGWIVETFNGFFQSQVVTNLTSNNQFQSYYPPRLVDGFYGQPSLTPQDSIGEAPSFIFSWISKSLMC